MNRDTSLDKQDEQLDEQLQVLIDRSAQFGVSPAVMEAITPALKTMAEQLHHAQYFVLQTLDQNWVMTQLSHRSQPDTTKNVIYLFATLEDATRANASNDPQILALPMPVTHILFQILAMKPVDSLIFLEKPGDLQTGTEIRRQTFQELVELYLQNHQAESRLPPDMA